MGNIPLNNAKIQEDLAEEGEIVSIKQDAPTKVGWMKVNKKRENTPTSPRKIKGQANLSQQPIGIKNLKKLESNCRF